MQLRSQSFELSDDFGTMMVATPASASPATDDDPLARVEKKLDVALRQLERLHQRIESLDLTLARALNR